MEAKLIQFSTVVVGHAHNPTVLNPDFLGISKIVPPEWGWEVAETLTTPPFAVVRYTNGVAVTVEFNKLQVTDVNPGNDPTASKAAEIGAAYVRALPHVRYTAVGVNFQSVVEVESPATYLQNRFIKAGPWDDPKRGLEAAGVRLVYPRGNHGRLTLAFDVGETRRPGGQGETNVVIANANFHRDCGENPTFDRVIDHLSNVAADWSLFRELLAEIVAD